MSTLSQNIRRVTSDFDNIRDAIVEKGVSVPAGTATARYAEKILDIETGVTPAGKITLTENATDVDISQYALADVAVESSEGDLDEFIAGRSIEVTSNLEVIPDFAFAGKSKLEVVNLPNATYIGKYAFSAELAAQSGSGSSGSSEGEGGETLEEDDSMVFNNKKLRTVNMPNVTNIDRGAFKSAENLEITELPDSLVVIEDYAFDGCPKVQLTQWPSNLVRIGYGFPTQEHLSVEDLPDTLEYVGSGITYAQIKSYLQQFADEFNVLDISQVAPKLFNIQFDSSLMQGRSNIFSEFSVSGDVVFPEGTKRIPDHIFEGYNPSITSITLPDTVLEVGNGAFAVRSNPGTIIPCSSVTLGNSVVKIGDNAFYALSQLTSIDLPESLQYIGDNAFGEQAVISSLHIPKDVEYIGAGAFSALQSSGNQLYTIVVDSENTHYDSRNNCNAIIQTSTNKLVLGCAGTVIPESVEIIGTVAFQHSSISSVSLPDSVIRIENLAFSECRSLAHVQLTNSLEYVGEQAFENVPAVINKYGFTYIDGVLLRSDSELETWYNFPPGIRLIAAYSCTSCSIREITIPSTIEYINEGAFQYSSMNYIHLPNSIHKLEKYLFQGCRYLKTIRIPGSIVDISECVFDQCSDLQYWDLREFTAANSPAPLQSCNIRSTYGGWIDIIPKLYFTSQKDIDAYSQEELWSEWSSEMAVWDLGD